MYSKDLITGHPNIRNIQEIIFSPVFGLHSKTGLKKADNQSEDTVLDDFWLFLSHFWGYRISLSIILVESVANKTQQFELVKNRF